MLDFVKRRNVCIKTIQRKERNRRHYAVHKEWEEEVSHSFSGESLLDIVKRRNVDIKTIQHKEINRRHYAAHNRSGHGIHEVSEFNNLSLCDTGVINDFVSSQISDSDRERLLSRINLKFCHANTAIDSEGNKNPDIQKANICVVCDRLIIGTEEVKLIEKDLLEKNRDRLSVESYEEHFCISLKRELVHQYELDDDELKGMLLSPRARCVDGCHYQCCFSCYGSCTQGYKEERSSPPKFSIANGFAIGHIPDVLIFPDAEGNVVEKIINHEEDLTDVICGAISPVRPFGRVFAFHGGKQKSIKGHFSLFSVDQSHVGGVINKYRQIDNAHKNIYIVLCGRMTPGQKALVQREAQLDTDVFLSLLHWFVKSSGHLGYQEVTPPDECPDPVVILQDEDTLNNTDESVDPTLECRMEGKTYYFSNENHQPNKGTSVFDSSHQFLEEMLQSNAPTLLMYGGSYLKSHEIDLVDAFPIQFPFGLGGPNGPIERKVPVSVEVCLEHYMRLSLNQFMRPDFILVCYHIWCRNASYKTGLIKCKSEFQGRALAEKISQLSVEDIKYASRQLSHAQESNDPVQAIPGNSSGTSFLQKITTSCKVLGHTTEAAKDARRKVYALTERFGSHSLFFTVTPDDECTFRVRMYANMGNEINVPRVDSCDSDCFLDFTLRQSKRLKYPGACSIYYQSVIQAVYELLGWDKNRNLKKGKGIFGDPEAICHGDEEQGRTTLHAHFLVWLKHFDNMRDLLFHNNEDIQERARDVMRQYIDHHFCSDYNYDKDLPVIHEECQQCLPLKELFYETENLQTLRDGRHKLHSSTVKGRVIKCSPCGGELSTHDVFNSVMKSYYEQSCQNNENYRRNDVTFPPSRYRQDIMTYRCMIDENELDASGEFFFNKRVRYHTAMFRMNEHDWKHRKPCFKHGLECRFDFPNQCHECGFIEDNSDDTKETDWHYVDPNKSSKTVCPFSVLPLRSNGSQYLNTHSHVITEMFGCNSNVQMGSPRCVFYVVHYTTKSTQKEDRGTDYDRIGHQVMKRIMKEKERLNHIRDIHQETDNPDLAETHENEEEDSMIDPDYPFKEGLCRFLIGMSVHLSQDVVSATMAHLLMSQKGSRFTFSHTFRDLMVNHMLNHLTGQTPSDFVLRRRNKGQSGELYMWPDYSINDYLYRPTDLENISFYEFGMMYEKVAFSFERLKRLNDQGLPLLNEDEMYFTEDHPGRRYCFLKKNKREVVPRLSMPNGYISDIGKMELDDDNPSISALKRRKEYAMVALILFLPFRNSSIFSITDTDSSLWGKYQRLLYQSQSPQHNVCNFFPYGIRILQNMQDMIQSRKCKTPADPLQSETILRSDNGKVIERECDDDDSINSDYSDEISIDGFFTGECNDYMHPSEHSDLERRNLDVFKKGCKRLVPQSIINTRADKESSIISHGVNSENDNTHIDHGNNTDVENQYVSNHQTSRYWTLLGFVVGASLNNEYGCPNESHLEIDESSTINNFHGDESFIENIDWEVFGFSPNFNTSVIPTMKSVADKMKSETNITLDNTQYVAYEIICSSFMLNMVLEGWNSQKAASAGFSVTDDDREDLRLKDTMEMIVQSLEDVGAKTQLLMFVTGPAGAGKSTAITVAQRFCYEFCRCLGVTWKDNTFLFTATTGCAAALFGGTTIHSSAYLCKNKESITDSMKREWKDVKVLIVDEVSMATENMMHKLNDSLNDYRRCSDPHSYLISDQMIFGGFSIIFAGDFRQIPPVGAKDDQLLYKSHGLWENSINVAIVLENSHRFADDPIYGEILKRMWKGVATRDDIDKINSRIIGARCTVSTADQDSDITYACPYNSERSAIHSSMFQKHIENFPSVDDDELPPEHTVVIEADIYKGSKRKPRKEKAIPDINLKLNTFTCDRICSNLSDYEFREGNKPVDPALKLYVGAHCMINSNDDVSNGIANGSLCRVVSIVRKNDNIPLKWRNYDGKKVYYLNANEIDHVVFEHLPRTKQQVSLEKEIKELKDMEDSKLDGIVEQKYAELIKENRRRQFRLSPSVSYCSFQMENLNKIGNLGTKMKAMVKVTVRQLPIILNDATTGHKLQGMSKDQVIVQAWDYRNYGWLYTVLSRVRTLNGLYLCERLDYRKYQNSCRKYADDLERFDERMKMKLPDRLKKGMEREKLGQ